MIWNTSIVHLTLGFPFCWRLGKGGKASERSHLIHMLRWLPAAALIVADAGYVGYDVVGDDDLGQRVAFSSACPPTRPSTAKPTSRWTSSARGSSTTGRRLSRSEGKPPIRGRLMRIHSCRHKVDVWLFTNVEDPKQLSLEDGGHLLSLAVGKRGIFQDLQADVEKGDADEPDVAAGASRGGSLHDRHAVVALPRCVGHAGTARRTPFR